MADQPTAGDTVAHDDDGRVSLHTGGSTVVLHPLWLRERSREAGEVDASNGQRLYEPDDLDADLRVVEARVSGAHLVVGFSDGHHCALCLDAIALAVGDGVDPEQPPAPVAWRSIDIGVPMVDWTEIAGREVMAQALESFFVHGFFVLRNTPTRPGSLIDIANRFGRVSPTSFGDLFDVQSKPDPDDLAYTPVGLAAHTDQPYRAPVPGLQFLHALVNDAPGGDSTVVDGLAAIEVLRREDPEAFAVLSRLDVEFRYDIGTDVKVGRAPVIELDRDGRLRHLRFSPRLDFAPLVDADVLDVFYRGRRWLAQFLNDPMNRLQFGLDAGDVLVVDNHRVLHGRTAFDPTQGHRHVQGCYIDHDGPQTLWRLLARDRRHDRPAAMVGE